ncbi:MAG: response regulator transcription factor [Sandaracinaceae bacterium]
MRVFVADDHPVVVEGLARILDAVPDLEHVGSTREGRDVLRRAREERWDVLILDLSGLGDAGGMEVLDQLRREVPELPVVIYSSYPEAQYGVRMLQAGAKAYIEKSLPVSTLLEAIRRVAGGGRYVTPGIAERLLEPRTASLEALSTRELQILQLVVDGTAVTSIAESLHVGVSTVSTHLRNIRQKLGAGSNAELVKIAIREGLAR